MIADNIEDFGSRYLMQTYRRLPITMVSGSGVMLRDSKGRDYIDLTAGIGVNSIGHAHPRLVETLHRQAGLLMQTSSDWVTVPPAQLARRLVELAFSGRVFLANSGAEANECAVKLARKWGLNNRGGAFEVITALGSFHGRTLAMVNATGQAKYSEPFRRLPEGFVHVAYGDIEAIAKAAGPKTAAVMLEPIIGEGGVLPAPPGYLQAVRRWCDENNVLLILDEIQTGVGRSGRWFAHQHAGISPDIMTLAKGLGGGFPISACLAAPKADIFALGDHGTTFGGNPLAAAVALTVLDVIESEGLVKRADELGRLVAEEFSGLDGVREVRGSGLMQGVVLDAPVARQVQARCVQEGVLVNVVGDSVLRLLPPLIIRESELRAAIVAVSRAIADVFAAESPVAHQANG